MNKILQIICACAIALVALPPFVSTFIEPDQIGVRQGLSGGVLEKDFVQQRILDLPVVHTIHRLPRTVQFQHYQESKSNPLVLRTSGNNDITVDVSIPYTIIPGEGWKIIGEGLSLSWRQKVDSTCQGFLREHLAQFTNDDVQKPERREELAANGLGDLNLALAQYHVQAKAIIIRAVAFLPKYEAKLMEKQRLVVQAELDKAETAASAATLATDTVKKGIEKQQALEVQIWRGKVEGIKTEIETKIAEVKAAAVQYDQNTRAAADATCSEAKATGALAEANAIALGEKLRAQALATRAGRTYAAIEAARAFKIGDVQLSSTDPKFLLNFGSMDAWRNFFLPRH